MNVEWSKIRIFEARDMILYAKQITFSFCKIASDKFPESRLNYTSKRQKLFIECNFTTEKFVYFSTKSNFFFKQNCIQ